MTVQDTSHAPSDLDQLPLSLNQEFLCVFDKGDVEGSFSHRHTLVYGWRIDGKIDLDTLQGALDDVVERHEALRTSIARGAEVKSARIHPPTSVQLLVRDLSGVEPSARDTRAEEFLNDLDAGTYSVHELPHLRAVLGRFDDTDAVLVIIAHHMATDAWSLQLIIRDLAACYATRAGLGRSDLPEVPQYREYAAWQLGSLGSPEVRASCDYWREKLRAAQLLAIPTDRPRTAGVANSYAVHRFGIDADLTAATLTFARAMRSSPFIVLLAAYNVLLRKVTGATDIVVPTFTFGRTEERFLDTVGPFLNFVPLRTDIADCETFRDVVERTRATCLEAYSNDIPFPLIANEAPELTSALMDPGLAVIAFEILQSPATKDGELVGGLRYSELRRRLLSQPVSSHIPDGVLWAMDVLPSGEIVGSVKFDSNLFDASTMVELATEFCRVLRRAVAAGDTAVQQI